MAAVLVVCGVRDALALADDDDTSMVIVANDRAAVTDHNGSFAQGDQVRPGLNT